MKNDWKNYFTYSEVMNKMLSDNEILIKFLKIKNDDIDIVVYIDDKINNMDSNDIIEYMKR